MDKVLVIGGCGYIGSRLTQALMREGFDVTSVDLEWFGKFFPTTNQLADYAHFDKGYFSQYRNVVLLAGHSSVKMCLNNLRSCFNNNVNNFVSLLHKLTKDQRFIYASSSSIYGGLSDELIAEDTTKYRALNFYDLSKYEIDSYAKLSDSVEYYGLRFGTVNGFSPNFRSDIMLNAMYKNAKEKGEIQISNVSIHRPLLGLNDLCKAIVAIIRNGTFASRGIYNLASFNSTVLNIGKTAADLLEVGLVFDKDKPDVYDFTISTEKFSRQFGFTFTDTIPSIIQEIQRGEAQITFTNRNSPLTYGPQT